MQGGEMKKTKIETIRTHEAILDLWAANKTYPQIADSLDVSEKAISNVLWRARKRNDVRAVRRGNTLSGMNFAGRPWTENDISAAKEIKRRFPKLSYEQIGAKIGRTGRAVQAKLMVHDNGSKLDLSHEPKITVPEFVEELRDRMCSVAPRDLTAAMFGDPLPGFSALDRRVAA
jgi:hypothetical protein